MPIYSYIREDNDEVVELTMSLKEKELKEQEARVLGAKLQGIYVDDTVFAKRAYHLDHRDYRNVSQACWPMKSSALGVGVDQIPEAVAEAKKYGIKAEFDLKTGDFIAHDKSTYNKYANLYGLHDRNCFNWKK